VTLTNLRLMRSSWWVSLGVDIVKALGLGDIDSELAADGRQSGGWRLGGQQQAGSTGRILVGQAVGEILCRWFS
jgi:hypothetical protein